MGFLQDLKVPGSLSDRELVKLWAGLPEKTQGFWVWVFWFCWAFFVVVVFQGLFCPVPSSVDQAGSLINFP